MYTVEGHARKRCTVQSTNLCSVANARSLVLALLVYDDGLTSVTFVAGAMRTDSWHPLPTDCEILGKCCLSIAGAAILPTACSPRTSNYSKATASGS